MKHLAASLLVAAACTTTSGADDPSQIGAALGQDQGGFDTGDEAPVFADQAGFAAMALESDAPEIDAVASDPEVAALAASAEVDSRQVLVLWGRMPFDPTSLDGRDWTGAFKVSRGALVIEHRIGFEVATDRLLPRLDRQTVAFQSSTRPFADGLALHVITDGSSAQPLTLTYTSSIDAKVSYAFDLAQLAAGPISIDAGDGNRMIAIAMRDHAACAHGFMRGRWHQLAASLGLYRGIVHDETGAPIGAIRGIYGQRATGEKVMFGKFIALDGTFLGLVGGTYDNGELRATWVDRSGPHGKVHGRYFESAAAEGGGFVARWAAAACAED